MASNSRSRGLFDLHNSDTCVGSFLRLEDVAEILEMPEGALREHVACGELTCELVEETETIDEAELRTWLKTNRSRWISLDELILGKLIKLAYPQAEVFTQKRWTGGRVDFKVSLNGVSKVIEYDGPQHFFGRTPHDPFLRKAEREKCFPDCNECVIWPYWIQLCVRNVRAIFEDGIDGYGALWSTEYVFGKFSSAHLIEQLTDRFRARRSDGFGYFYGPNTVGRKNPEHWIVEKIRRRPDLIQKLVPRDVELTGHGIADWIPEPLLDLLPTAMLNEGRP